MRVISIEVRPDIEKALARFDELNSIIDCDQVVACSFNFNEEYDKVILTLACFFAAHAGVKL